MTATIKLYATKWESYRKVELHRD